MIEGFARRRIDCGAVTLSVQEAGQGAPLVLLHGFPQNGMCWGPVAPAFARHFRVIVPDLRGYGESDAPPDDADHRAYAKRTMARDMVGLLDALGIGRAMVLGHDRGARVAYRLALDHPGRVFLGLALLHRYKNSRAGSRFEPLLRLLDEGQIRDAEILGKAMRFGAMFAVAEPEAAGELRLTEGGRRVELHLGRDGRALFGEVSEARFRALAQALKAEPVVRDRG